MAPRLRRHITHSEKTLLWERWQQGESLHQIARWLGRRNSSTRHVIAQAGGIRPVPRHRSLRALALGDQSTDEWPTLSSIHWIIRVNSL